MSALLSFVVKLKSGVVTVWDWADLQVPANGTEAGKATVKD